MLNNWIEILRTGDLSPGRPMDSLSRWLLATRASVLTMTLTSVLIGGLLAQPTEPRQWLWWSLALIGVTLAHAIRCNWAWLKGLVYSILRDTDDIDDVLQDICVRLISKIDSLRQPERFRPWLAVLARRQALRYRQQKTRRPIPLDEELAELKCDEKAQQILENIEQKEQYQLILEFLFLIQ